jgi:hypothetical protein
MMEKYYESCSKLYYAGQKVEEAFPENAYQVIIIIKLLRTE